MSKPGTLEEYIDWAKTTLGIDLEDINERTLYHYNVQNAFTAVINSPFLKGLNAQLAKWAEEYKTQTGSDLLMENSRLSPIQKPYDSAINKSFRKNIILNDHYPGPPKKGWITPKNLPDHINDSVRGTLVCKFIDGPSYVSARLTDYADALGLRNRQYSQERDEGYYAYHFYAGFDVELYNNIGQVRKSTVDMEIQITTQFQEVLRSLTHRFYEERRLQSEVDHSKWKWDHKSNRFRVGYLSHALHLLEAMITESRDKVHESSQGTSNEEGGS